MADVGQFLKAVRETANLRLMPPQKLIEYEQYFAGQLLSFGSDPRAQQYQQQCQAQIELLRSELERRSLAIESKRQHEEVYGIGKKTLCWSRVAGVAGIAAVIV